MAAVDDDAVRQQTTLLLIEDFSTPPAAPDLRQPGSRDVLTMINDYRCCYRVGWMLSVQPSIRLPALRQALDSTSVTAEPSWGSWP